MSFDWKWTSDDDLKMLKFFRNYNSEKNSVRGPEITNINFQRDIEFLSYDDFYQNEKFVKIEDVSAQYRVNGTYGEVPGPGKSMEDLNIYSSNKNGEIFICYCKWISGFPSSSKRFLKITQNLDLREEILEDFKNGIEIEIIYEKYSGEYFEEFKLTPPDNYKYIGPLCGVRYDGVYERISISGCLCESLKIYKKLNIEYVFL
jgi:hypothetical protein